MIPAVYKKYTHPETGDTEHGKVARPKYPFMSNGIENPQYFKPS